jgi:hypothetical protein
LNILLRCIERMPCSGPLFTSQSPFFPVFIMGIMSYRDRDRKVVRDWFEQVLARAGARSVSLLCLPPPAFVLLLSATRLK